MGILTGISFMIYKNVEGHQEGDTATQEGWIGMGEPVVMRKLEREGGKRVVVHW